MTSTERSAAPSLVRAPLWLRSTNRLRLVHWGARELLMFDHDTDRLFVLDAEFRLVPQPSLPSANPNRTVAVVGDDPRQLLITQPTTSWFGPLQVWAQTRTGGTVVTSHQAEVARTIAPWAATAPWLGLADQRAFRLCDGVEVGARPEPDHHEALAVIPAGVLGFGANHPLTLYPLDGAPPRTWTDDLESAQVERVALRGDTLIVAAGDAAGTLFALSATTLAESARTSIGEPIRSAAPLGPATLLVGTDDGTLLVVDDPFGGTPRIERVARAIDGSHLVTHGERWLALGYDTAYVGRAGRPAATFVRLARPSGTPTACVHGIVLEREGTTILIPWEAFDGAGALDVTPIEIALAPPALHRARVLQAGATIIRVEIAEPPPHWRRKTMTIGSGGNPLGLRVGDEIFAEGHEVGGELHDRAAAAAGRGAERRSRRARRRRAVRADRCVPPALDRRARARRLDRRRRRDPDPHLGRQPAGGARGDLRAARGDRTRVSPVRLQVLARHRGSGGRSRRARGGGRPRSALGRSRSRR